ncbi:endonuclease VII domain-containing protein [Bradyrhizobium barranii]
MPARTEEAKLRKREYNKAYRAANLQRISENQRAYREARKVSAPTYAANKSLMRKYGITVEKRAEMLAAQGFRCALCPSDDPGPKGQWHVDHCHDTGKVRALLCMQCNVGIGNLQHSPALLRAAADYIEKHANDTR